MASHGKKIFSKYACSEAQKSWEWQIMGVLFGIKTDGMQTIKVNYCHLASGSRSINIRASGLRSINVN